ncbi:hypothetical protein L0Z36_07230 [Burkholderia multivorans]|jgi:hypothetical protein|uniref:Uncharacterized protein n=1 Tax=Pandoraea nosoerga TaxID=2508296 RepID=A0A5E4X5Q3_9BURK|nr:MULTISPECIES: hypothetical protein [Burkholderiaceae]MCJ9707888.1 hypothetical protein [Bordetella hinzii]QDX21437.1 hypothetical protein FP568_09365 [Pandoraea pnomenusa]UQP01696.1 hypothetical protein L0Z36_07230 [Burkholderia multivorans]VVE31623.1 hypothetical protein PNO31109_03663 [Pandoraea nosoerga]
MQDPNKNNTTLYFDVGRTLFNVITLALLNVLLWLLAALFTAVYLMHANGDVSTNAHVTFSAKFALLALIPLNWFYWKTKMRGGKWRYLFYRDWK